MKHQSHTFFSATFIVGISLLTIFTKALIYSQKYPSLEEQVVTRETTETVRTPSFSQHPCWTQFPDDFPYDVECGYISVAEDRTKVVSPVNQLATMVIKTNNPNPKTPLLYLEGGPGGHTVENAEYILFSFPHFLDERDLILFDQRGVGNSIPSLRCPNQDEHYPSELRSVEEQEKDELAYIDTCLSKLKETTLDLTNYHSVAVAADVYEMMRVLGYKKVDLYGISYGTTLALTIMRDYPSIIHAAVLDSVVPLDIELNTATPGVIDQALHTLFTACEKQKSCKKIFPHLYDSVLEIFHSLNKRPEYVPYLSHGVTSDVMKYDGYTFMNHLIFSLYFSDVIPYLPLAISQAAEGNFDFFLQLASYQSAVEDSITDGYYFSVICNERLAFESEESLRNAYAQYPHLQYSGGVSEKMIPLCKKYFPPRVAPIQNYPVRSSIPTLLMAGQFDPVTPLQWAVKAAITLENATIIHVPTLSHGPSADMHPCPKEVVLSFLENTKYPDLLCLHDMGPTHFYTSEKETSGVLHQVLDLFYGSDAG